MDLNDVKRVRLRIVAKALAPQAIEVLAAFGWPEPQTRPRFQLPVDAGQYFGEVVVPFQRGIPFNDPLPVLSDTDNEAASDVETVPFYREFLQPGRDLKRSLLVPGQPGWNV